MSELNQKIRHLIEDVPRDEGIKGFIKLQAEVPENMKYKCRFACLHLMEMNHDWDGIRKFIAQWKLVRSFGKDLVLRMRKRVGQEQGTVSDDVDVINKELERLNEKNWRQFSPKKTFPQYFKLLTQISNKESKLNQLNPVIQPKKQQNTQKQKKQKQERSSLTQGGSLFSRLSQYQKVDKNKEINSRGVFSKQLQKTDSGESLEKKTKVEKARLPIQTQNREIGMQKIEQKKVDLPNPILKKPQNSKLTPSKQGSKKIVSVKYGNQRQTINEESKDEFSFSAIKARQMQGMSQKKSRANEEQDNSFFNFTNESRIKERIEFTSERKGNILDDMKLEEEFIKSNNRLLPSKPLFCEQELSLIDPSNPPKSYIKTILHAEGNSPLQMLKTRLLKL